MEKSNFFPDYLILTNIFFDINKIILNKVCIFDFFINNYIFITSIKKYIEKVFHQ